MFYTVYKITNKLNGKFYIGKHQTLNVNDGYMGSGKLIKYAISKYGVENFDKEILAVCNNEIDMNNMEKKLVVLSENSYNLCEGGNGGFSYINNSNIVKFKGKKHTNESKKKMAHYGNTHKKGIPISDAQKKAISEKNSVLLKGKLKSEEHKRKIRESILKRHRG